tara:strand:+ start:110 stop:292 length:183 start_codon:yes stop_codon:yes gene_type:complete
MFDIGGDIATTIVIITFVDIVTFGLTIVTGTSDDSIAGIIDEFTSGAIINVDETIFRNYL